MRTKVANCGECSRRLQNLEVSDIALFIFFCVLNGHRSQELPDRIAYVAAFGVLLFSAYFMYIGPRKTGKSEGNISLFFAWYAVFWGYSYLSVLWSVDSSSTLDVTKMDDVLQIFTVLPYILFRIENKEDLILVLKLFVLSVFYSVVVLVLKTPVGQWGSERVGEAIGLHANDIGMRMGYAAFFAYYIFLNTKKIKYLVLIPIFACIVLFSGSRKAILILVGTILAFELLSFRGVRDVSRLMIAVLIVIGFAYITMTNEVLYQVIGSRLDGLFASITGQGEIDSSTLYREMYRDNAFDIWVSSPLLGTGMDTFRYFNLLQTGAYVYCHCNYLELLSGQGFIGFILYYSFFIIMLKRLWRGVYKKDSNETKSVGLLGLVLLCSIVVFDYGFVSYDSFTMGLYLSLVFCCQRINSANQKDRQTTIRNASLIYGK